MATISKPYIITVLLFLAGTPLLHQFLHSADGPSESYVGEVQTLPSEKGTYQQTLIKSPDVSPQNAASRIGTPAIFGSTPEKSASKDESADTQRDMDLALVEIGPPLNADEPTQWTQEKYGQEIDIGVPRSADTWTYDEASAFKQPVNIEQAFSELYPDIIEIGPEKAIESDY
jgi:hypothetical protein